MEVVAARVDGGLWWLWLGSLQLADGCWLGSLCRCEIKPVDNEDRSQLNEEKQERNIKENLPGAQTTRRYASFGPQAVPRPRTVFVFQPFVRSVV
jgi:hypothetical protein